MRDFTGLDALNRVHERREERTVKFHPVPRNVDDHNSESQLLEIVLMLKTLIDGNQNIAPALSLSNQLGVGKRAPLGFGNRQDFVIGKGLPQGVD